MSRTDISAIYNLVRACTADVILRAAALCDGHSILHPQAFLEAGLPPEVVKHLTWTHRSDTRDPKATISRDGQVVDKVEGVYGLYLLEFLAEALHVPYERKLGRGSQAVAVREALHRHLKPAAIAPGEGGNGHGV